MGPTRLCRHFGFMKVGWAFSDRWSEALILTSKPPVRIDLLQNLIRRCQACWLFPFQPDLDQELRCRTGQHFGQRRRAFINEILQLRQVKRNLRRFIGCGEVGGVGS